MLQCLSHLFPQNSINIHKVMVMEENWKKLKGVALKRSEINTFSSLECGEREALSDKL